MRVRLAMNLASLQATAFPETLRRATDIPFFCLAQKGDVQVCLFIIDAACQKNKRKENVYLSFSFSFSFFCQSCHKTIPLLIQLKNCRAFRT